MGERWIAEAEDLRANGSSGTMSRNHNNPKVTWHVTVSHPGSFDVVHRVLTNKRSEPQILYDPVGDRLGQYFALDRGGRALRNDGSIPTNRDGTINIQIEVCAMPGDIRTGQMGFTDLPEFDPTAPNWRALMRAIRSWGIPDHFAGPIAQGSWASDAVPRSWSTYRRSGHHVHAGVPGNSHWDTGKITEARIFATGGGYVPPPSPSSSSGMSLREVQELLGVTPDGVLGPNTRAAVRDIQEALGIAIDGDPGPVTKEKLMSLMDKLDEIERLVRNNEKDIDQIRVQQHRELVDEIRTTPARVWNERLDTPGSVLKQYPWMNKTYSAGGTQMYNLFSFAAKGDHDEILAAIKAEQDEQK